MTETEAEKSEGERKFKGGSRASILPCGFRIVDCGLVDARRFVNGGSVGGRGVIADCGVNTQSAIRNRLVDDSSRGGQSDDQEHEEQDQEQARQELGNSERRTGNRREPEKGRDDADDQEDQRHVEHDFTLRIHTVRNACRRIRMW